MSRMIEERCRSIQGISRDDGLMSILAGLPFIDYSTLPFAIRCHVVYEHDDYRQLL